MLSRHWFCVSISLSLACSVAPVYSQDFPSRPVRLVVANSPGGITDLASRLVAPEFSKFLGQPVIVENKPGARNLIGYEYVAKQAPADGYTLVTAVTSELAVYPVTVKDLRFDPVRDLPAIIGLVEARLVVGSSSSKPWKTFEELVAYSKANPGKLNVASSSALTRLLGVAVIQALGLNVVDVPYTGGGPMFQALLVGQADMGFVGESTAIPNAEKFRVLAVTGDRRRPPFLDVPTFAELGHAQIPGLFLSLNGRVDIPRPIVEKLGGAAYKALQQPDIKARFGKLSLAVVEEPPETTVKRVPDEARLYADIARKAGMQAQ